MEQGIDARIARTQRSLRTAALHLASETPIAEVSVSDLAREAGINRATFYKHAASPLQVLREALVDDLDAMRVGFLDQVSRPETDLVALWREAALATAEHVARFDAIYRRDFTEDSSGSLQSLLSRHIAVSMEEMFRRRPALMPPHATRDRALLASAYASFIGNGLTGILHVWFMSEARDERVYAEAVVHALPAWMLHPRAVAPSVTRSSRARAPRHTRGKRKEEQQ